MMCTHMCSMDVSCVHRIYKHVVCVQVYTQGMHMHVYVGVGYMCGVYIVYIHVWYV